MSEIERDAARQDPEAVERPRRAPLLSGSRISLAAAAVVILLALGALIWPGGAADGLRGVCLVYDPLGAEREADLYRPLIDFLAENTGRSLRLRRVVTAEAFLDQAAVGVDLALCPDGLALALDSERYTPLVAGRRTAPRNLRPRCVLISRVGAAGGEQPWLVAPRRTIFGDSLSLCATGVLRTRSGADPGLPEGCASGPDPYDHSPALHALRVGCFDHAIVRQWDAERFFTEELLPGDEWEMEILGGPVPDLVLLVSREVPAAQRLAMGGTLSHLGRTDRDSEAPEGDLEHGLRRIHLAGFNLLVEPDLELIRSSYPGRWLPAGQ